MEMARRNRRPTSPGVILLNYYLKPRQLSIAQFASAADITRKHASNIIHGKADITPEMAVRFARVLDTTPEFWMNLQNAVNLHDAREHLSKWRPKEVHPAVLMQT